MSTSSIDELLLSGGNSTQPKTPEHQYQDEPEPIEEAEVDSPKHEADDVADIADIADESVDSEEDDVEESKDVKAPETDEYGNEREPENKEIRERLKKQAESMTRRFQAEIDDLRAQLAQQGASREVQQAAKDFEYNPEESGDWQQQLASFVKQTVSSMNREQQELQERQENHKVQVEFEGKFKQGMSKFDDFVEVISDLPFEISNPMTLATRAMADPAAFLYAAAKRQPQELERISKIRDPYAQMTEMGKLEERMRRNKPTTKAPRPLGRTHEDTGTPAPKKKSEASIEDLIAKSDAKRIQRMKSRGSSRR